MASICLLFPPKIPYKKAYPDFNLNPPLGLLLIAASIERFDFTKFDVIDARIYMRDHSYDELNNYLLSKKYDFLLITSMFTSYPFIINFSKKYKERYPDTIIIVGGPHASVVSEDTISHFHQIDLIVRGEGETTIQEVMGYYLNRNPKSLADIKGITYQDQLGNTMYNEDRELIDNLNDLPLPAYHLIDMHEYIIKDFRHTVSIITSRGCIYKCSFCAVAPLWKRKNRTRSISAIIDEIKYLNKEYNIRHFSIEDDTFTINRNRVIDFCETLINENLNISFSCFARINHVDEEIIDLMLDAGLNHIFFGVEAASDDRLNAMNKGITREKSDEVVQLVLDKGVDILASFIIGLPNDTVVDLQDTISLALSYSLRGCEASLVPFMPLNGSSIVEDTGIENIIDPPLQLDSPHNSTYFGKSFPESEINLIRQYPKIMTPFFNVKKKFITNQDICDFIQEFNDEQVGVSGFL
ncbi:MAG: B12-binding domain-containing radical SAM protein [Candidatus Kariarchaeaceae archaeon]